MIIEIDTPIDEIREPIIKDLKKELTRLHHEYKGISRATVHFRKEEMKPFLWEYICEIDLAIFGNSIIVSRKTGNWDAAAKEAILAVTNKINELARKENQPPDEEISTVNV